jgi:hypothetical protein
MGNLGEVKPISKIIISIDGVDYEMAGGGGVEPGVPLPDDTVDTNAIIDGAVQEQDLNDSVKGRMTVTHDSATGGLRLGGYAQAGNIPANSSQDVGQGGGEDEDLDDDETGFDTDADDGEDDI